ncbi:putative invertase inhibitor [Mercurialis annua]|uniref:putative invertase inhibitor n=1 Tax=Mercurialis annua TaxID=3986 RepID=UPI002160D1A4|nr:putative invertase inhibitor [Mercurialis annua]
MASFAHRFLIIISSLSLITCSARFHATQDLISTACSHTLYYEICISSLNSDPRTKTADLQELANVALNLTISYGQETLAHITDLKSTARGNDTVSSCLGDCMEVFSDAVEELNEAIDALRIKSLENVKTFVSAAMTDSDTCDEGFKEIGFVSPVSDKTLYFSKLCSIFLAIVNLLT